MSTRRRRRCHSPIRRPRSTRTRRRARHQGRRHRGDRRCAGHGSADADRYGRGVVRDRRQRRCVTSGHRRISKRKSSYSVTVMPTMRRWAAPARSRRRRPSRSRSTTSTRRRRRCRSPIRRPRSTRTRSSAAGIKVADIVVTDDALGTETLTLCGADAASFAIVGNELCYIGASPNFEAQSSYSVTVNADDATLGDLGSVEASQTFTLTVNDVNEAPTAVSFTTRRPRSMRTSDVSGGHQGRGHRRDRRCARDRDLLALSGADAAFVRDRWRPVACSTLAHRRTSRRSRPIRSP